MFQTRRFVTATAAAFALTFAASTAAVAQTADYTRASAGTYTIDTNHTAVVARVPHQQFSFEIFRFGAVTGQVIWNPATPASNQLSVTVLTTSIQTPVEGFAEELQGARYLNAAQFPQATFVSTAFRAIDASHGEVDGNLTLKGVTRPVTFNVELIGAGQNSRGRDIIGVHATTTINNADYSFPGFIQGQSQIVIDGEFQK